MQQKNTKPFWSLVILFVMILAFRVTILVALSSYYKRVLAETEQSFAKGILFSIVLQMSFALAMVAAEAYIYWLLRRRLHKLSWVWLHVSSLYFVLLVIPLMKGLLPVFFADYFGKSNYLAIEAAMSWIRMILFWSFMLVGHLFFVLTIVYGFRKMKVAEPASHESSHLLDEFTE